MPFQLTKMFKLTWKFFFFFRCFFSILCQVPFLQMFFSDSPKRCMSYWWCLWIVSKQFWNLNTVPRQEIYSGFWKVSRYSSKTHGLVEKVSQTETAKAWWCEAFVKMWAIPYCHCWCPKIRFIPFDILEIPRHTMGNTRNPPLLPPHKTTCSPGDKKTKLGGGYFLCSPLFGEDSHFELKKNQVGGSTTSQKINCNKW